MYGKTAPQVKTILQAFVEDKSINPLVATVQTLATGVNLHTVANTVIFMNKPWRHVDYEQASDRVHRIGQDVPVYIYSFRLDTGKEPNLSTRMEDIVEWSKEMFRGIVGTIPEKQMEDLVIKSLGRL